jgi:hypothetical protein
MDVLPCLWYGQAYILIGSYFAERRPCRVTVGGHLYVG